MLGIYNLMDYMAGSIRDVRQYYFAADTTADELERSNNASGSDTPHQNETERDQLFRQGRLEGE